MGPEIGDNSVGDVEALSFVTELLGLYHPVAIIFIITCQRYL